VRSDAPSLTAQLVAVARSALERPSAPTGDAAADERLTALVAGGGSARLSRRPADDLDGLFDYIAVRTAFFDQAVVRAIGEGVGQVVILGAGYDGRALRFRSPGVRFFEVDHPATQQDKRARLAEVGATVDDVTFVAADFTEPGLGDALAAAGHDRRQRSLFVLEGVLRYLPERWYRELLRTLATGAALGSELAVSISTRDPDDDATEAAARRERERLLEASGEPVLTVPESTVALAWVADAGWSVRRVADVADAAPGLRRGRLLVRATR